MAHPGIVYSREKLLDEIWGMDYDGETRTVDVHIRTLRAKLKEAGEAEKKRDGNKKQIREFSMKKNSEELIPFDESIEEI